MYSSFVVPWKLGERICYPLCYQPWPQPPLGPQPYLFLCLGTVMVAGKTLQGVEVLWHWEGRGWCTKALVTISSNSCLHLSGEDSRSLGPPARVLRSEGWMKPTPPPPPLLLVLLALTSRPALDSALVRGRTALVATEHVPAGIHRSNYLHGIWLETRMICGFH